MDTKVYLNQQVHSMWELQDAALEGLTEAQLGFLPGGTVSPIGVIWLHMMYSEDSFIAILMGKPSLWDSGWKERFNLERPPDFGADWGEFKEKKLTVALLGAYTEAVREAIKTCLAVTTAETLDETLKFFTESDPKAAVWVLLSQHSLLHSGEIAAIKGMQGVKGLPF